MPPNLQNMDEVLDKKYSACHKFCFTANELLKQGKAPNPHCFENKYYISSNNKPDELCAWVDIRANVFECQFAKLQIMHFTLDYRAYLGKSNICGRNGTVWMPLLLNELFDHNLKPFSFALDMSLWETNSPK